MTKRDKNPLAKLQ